ncbi:MAG: RIP metalloprotease RseP [Bdellovibrionota bacterium]
MNILSAIFSNTIIAFIILISIIVFVHELGHFIAGKIFKIQVEEFSIGFGPAAYTFKKGPTLYRINWLPLGGYVRFYGADISENIPLQNQEKSFLHAKVYKRAIVSFAGPFANFLLSLIIMLGLVCHGIPTQPNTITVIPHSVAEHAGLQTGDKIISINNKSTENWPDLVNIISKNANNQLLLVVERDHKNISLSITPQAQSSETIYGTQEKSGKIGITPLWTKTSQTVTIKASSVEDALQKAFHYLFNQMAMIYKGLKLLFSGSIPLSNLGGPLAVASIAGDAAKAGMMTFFLTMSLISVNIGMVNLLPLPALDGGALLLNVVEVFYGKSLPKKVQIAVQRAGILMILFLFVLVFYNDILRLAHP